MRQSRPFTKWVALPVIALLAGAIVAPAASAGEVAPEQLEFTIEVLGPPDVAANRGDPGSRQEKQITGSTPDAAIGRECAVTVTSRNQQSVHRGTDMEVSSGAATVTVFGVEDAAFEVMSVEETLLISEPIVVTVILGEDGVSSFSGDVSFSCEPPCVSVPPTEVLYLSDSRSPVATTPSELFEVVLDDVNQRALLQPLLNGQLTDFPRVDALAATPDGEQLYFVDKAPLGTGELGVYDVSTNVVSTIGPVQEAGATAPVVGVVLAAFSADGVLYVANDDDNALFRVDPATGSATRLGTILDVDSGLEVDVSGADIAFGSDGTLYLWANASPPNRGLYRLTLPAAGGMVGATFLGENPSSYTGMAVRDGGDGDLVVSARADAQNPGRIQQISRTDASVVDTFVMYLDADRDGQADGPDAYPYPNGDMTIGQLGGQPCEPPPPPPPPVCTAEEVLYLSDSRSPVATTPSELFEVVLDDVNQRALLQPLVNGELTGFARVDALAATPDGEQLYFFDKAPLGTGELGVYDVATNVVTTIGSVEEVNAVAPLRGVVLAAFSPDGVLYVANDDDNALFTVDASGTGIVAATRLGTILDVDSGLEVDVSGADIAFGSDGTLYLWANASPPNRGLYRLTLPAAGGMVGATFLGENPSSYTGMAVRDGGDGDLVVSARADAQNPGRIQQISRTDASVVDTFVMYLDADRDGQADGPDAYPYPNGDMTIGELCVPSAAT